jgi:subtilisin-like proprotein convertase family protein
MPVRLNSELGSQSEADSFAWAADHGADVISCSWGPPDGDWFDPTDPQHQVFEALPDSTRLAIDYAVTKGRKGRGSVVLFAAGNGNESVDNDGYASYPKVIAVAACNDRGVRSVYSDFGSAVHCSFPSNDFGFDEENRPEPLTDGIWTTDRSGARGYGTGDYTSSFGGTSSACPGAAGVAALVLSRNPALRWDQVRDLLKRSCDRIDAANGAYDASGHSDKYGYGRLNAFAAVQLAAPAEAPERLTVRRTYQAAVADFQKTSVALPVGASGALESLEVQVDVEHTYIGDLVVSLIPPPGMGAGSVRLHDRTGGATRNIRRTYDALSTPNLKSYAGKDPAGEWTLEVRDEAKLDQGTIRGLALVLTFRSELRSAVSRRASSDASRKTSRGARARNGR